MTQNRPPAPGANASSDPPLPGLLTDAVREAGALALTFFGRDAETRIKPDGTVVSEADIAVDDLLRARLCGAGADIGWLSEESGDGGARLDRSRVWIVDPIDGTRAFLKGKPEWTISAALAENGEPVLAAVYNPATGEFFHAARGQGAFLDGTHITVRDPVALEGCRLAASSNLLRPGRWETPWPPLETIWVNSIAYRLALAAAGLCDGTVSLSRKSDWDLAAAHLLVQEAGGIVSTHTGAAINYNRPDPSHPSVVAAGPALHAALVARTARHRR